ncbi:GntR family transcriptional regulator [Roseomonas terrae]|jgi:DNA-binding GntR family transcriptional regulator|uniref:GntR family transcriptional regulator n=1 Tax=Neoroseomonas terrae TaxID=424799 RepID=A0ABS5ENI9_9PROT|nr:GntR family transcriptional regulator [Neoroseomonas terrae]MBR0652591.1 GntR family transcriptional regulator [Neoroseomonas terrae]
MIESTPITHEDAVTAQLRRLIVEGALPPGAKLTVSALAARLGAGATPVRAALKLLEGEGLVEALPYRGARVRALATEDIRNIYRLRAAVLGVLVPDVVRHVSNADLDALDALEARFEAAAEAGDGAGAMAVNQQFHRLLFATARNPDAAAVMERSWALVEALRLRLGFSPGRLQRSAESHRALLAALRGRDTAAAAGLAVASSNEAMADLLARAAAPRREAV